MAKKSIETGEDCDAIPDSMRQYLTFQAMESGKCLERTLPLRSAASPYGVGSGDMLLGGSESNHPSKVGRSTPALFPLSTLNVSSDVGPAFSPPTVIHHLACRALRIGTWRRVGLNAMDLVIFYSPDKACITYYINNDSAGYKIEYPFSAIKHVNLDQGEPSADGSLQPGQPSSGGLVVELSRPPNFFMDSSGSGGFYQCGDFTEDQQASRVLLHRLGGHPKVLSGQLAKLVGLETFRNRHGFAHQPHPYLAMMPASAPVSPGLHRPASQPNRMVRPDATQNLERRFGPHLYPGRGHKRQRSRSVPAAVDFTALGYPLPAFSMMPHEAPMSSPSQQTMPTKTTATTTLFAPTPLHHQPMAMSCFPGSNLRIDTSSDHGIDFRPYPLSATTTVSPSEFASPSVLGVTTIPPEPNPTTMMYHTPYSLPFLSPHVDPSVMMDPSASPSSCLSPGDPVIANQSPPLSTMDRRPSAELFHLPDDPSTVMDDGMSLTELYSKQSLHLSMPSPGAIDGSVMLDATVDDLAMQSMITFDTIDPLTLTPEEPSL